jgi:hypothetical protein
MSVPRSNNASAFLSRRYNTVPFEGMHEFAIINRVGMQGERQGLPLVHFSAQPEPFWHSNHPTYPTKALTLS